MYKRKPLEPFRGLWNDRASDNRMYDDTNKRVLSSCRFSCFHTRQHFVRTNSSPSFVRAVLICLAFFNTPSTRETRDSSEYGLLLRTIEFITKKEAALACQTRPVPLERAPPTQNFGSCIGRSMFADGKMYRGCLPLFIGIRLFAEMKIFVSLVKIYFCILCVY